MDSGKVVCPSKGCGEITVLPVNGGLEALTSNHLAASSTSEGDSGGETCEECLTNEGSPAVQQCLDCGQCLCEVHAQAHRQSRRTHSHRLTNDTKAWSQPPPVRCKLHESCEVQSYCRSCELLICEGCVRLATHADHSVASLEEAGTFAREQLMMKTRKARGESVQKLQQAPGDVSRSITKVNEAAEEHSAAIEDEKKEFVRLLEQDEKQNIDAVDGQRWSKLKILERQEQRLKNVTALAQRAIDLTTASSVRLTDAQLLEMSSVFERCLSEAAEEALH